VTLTRHSTKISRSIMAGLCLAVLWAGWSPAQLLTPGGDDSQPIETKGDEIKYDRDQGIVEVTGNAVVTKGNQVLRADYIRVNLNTEEAFAAGNVELNEGEEVLRTRSLSYNFNLGKGTTPDFTGHADPFYVVGEKTEKAGDLFFVHRAEISTCELEKDHWHWHVKAKKVEVAPEDYIKAWGARWYFGRVPMMYVPYWFRDLDDEFGFRLSPGYDSRMGAFALGSYRYRVNPYVRGETHLDYRTERGVAGGQDVKWRDPEGLWSGDLVAYYADDKKPVDDDEDSLTRDIDNERYRIRVRHQQSFTLRDYFVGRGDYLSDTDILEDFFEDDYRESVEPDNYASYTHRGDRYTANVIARSRLNDFYESVNRLPEASLDIMRARIGQSPFYYESETAAASLEHVFPEQSGEDEYDSFRFDTAHTLYHQSKQFGFLNLVPRLGYRGTYYSTTRDTETVSESGLVTTTNWVVDVNGVTNALLVTTPGPGSTVTREVEGDADLRSLFELGCEASFKAFKVWDDPLNPRRHIVEPYANYTLVPEPDLVPDDLLQFDDVDRLDEEHFVKLGVRNKWQAKVKDNPFDLVDADVYTILKFETDPGEDAIENLYFDVELRPSKWLDLDLDGIYSVADSEMDRFNAWARLRPGESFRGRLEYRYRREESSLVITDVTLYPKETWSYNLFARHEFEESRFEEGGGYVQRRFDCMVFRTGFSFMPGYTRDDGTEKDDEYRAIVEFWLTAFPGISLSSRHRD